MVCIEPNPDFCKIALMNWKSYPSVEVINKSIEGWNLKPEAFDAVFAASSMHWILAMTGYLKVSISPKEDSRLILLWNKGPQRC